jgi:hypothetical protein
VNFVTYALAATESAVPATVPDANRARRAIGAMFYLAFGGAWLEYYASRVVGKQLVVFVAIALATAALLFLAYQRYRQNQPALAAEAPSLKQKRADRIFNIVNAGQWVVILVAGNVLVNLGLSSWVIPCAIFIVGLHFLPLAYVLGNPPHYVTGIALVVLAVFDPLLAVAGPASPIGCLGAGLILWASAFWALKAKNPFKVARAIERAP